MSCLAVVGAVVALAPSCNILYLSTLAHASAHVARAGLDFEQSYLEWRSGWLMMLPPSPLLVLSKNPAIPLRSPVSFVPPF
jgi:hypothetical protein